MLMLPKTRLQSKNLTNLLQNLCQISRVPDTCLAPYLEHNTTKNCREQYRPISSEVSLRSQGKGGHTRIESSILIHVHLFNWSRPSRPLHKPWTGHRLTKIPGRKFRQTLWRKQTFTALVTQPLMEEWSRRYWQDEVLFTFQTHVQIRSDWSTKPRS